MTIKYIKHPNITLEDADWCENVGGEFFELEDGNSEKMSELWNFENTTKFSHAWTMIKDDHKCIGYTLVYPAKNKIMSPYFRKNFPSISSSISSPSASIDAVFAEKKTADRILEEVTYENCDAAYISASFIDANYQNRGYALKAVIDSIKCMDAARGKRIEDIYFWAFSDAAKNMVDRAASFATLDGRKMHVAFY